MEQWHFILKSQEGLPSKRDNLVTFTLINPVETDAEGNTRGFSLASAPYEADSHVCDSNA